MYNHYVKKYHGLNLFETKIDMSFKRLNVDRYGSGVTPFIYFSIDSNKVNDIDLGLWVLLNLCKSQQIPKEI